ncbi:hypothetical protein KR074_002821 [Drosophila pseudoananassae]|nr:hypothetical protein KR074_002821 [Drosophila pseudoananassae]
MWFRLSGFMVTSLSLVLAQNLSLSSILNSIKLELSFRTILVLQSSDEHGPCRQLNELDLNLAYLRFNNNQSNYLKGHLNRELLALVCLDQLRKNEIMNALLENLQDMRGTPVLFMVNMDTNISLLFEECRSSQMLNVLALKGNNLEIIYGYKAFPRFQVVQRRITLVNRYYEPQEKDLQGHPIATIPYNLLPRCVIYKDKEGRNQMSGYLTHFYKNFAKALNGTLWVRWDLVPEDGTPTHNATWKLLADGLVDFPLVLTTLNPEPFYPSYVSEITSWFLMVPVEPDMPPSSLYFNLKGWRYFLGLMVILAMLLVNAHHIESGQGYFTLHCGHIFGDHVLRAMLAQSFVMPSSLSHSRTILYSLLMLAGLIVTTFYSTNLATLLVDPPPAFKILSYNDLRLTNGKIFISQQELPTLNESIGRHALETNLDVFEITPSTVEFLTKRNELNTSYGYPVTNTLWPLLQLKQIKLHRPLFRKSNEISFMQFMPVTMPMARNSIYRDVFNRYLSHTLESGLYDLWFRRSYSELIDIGKLNFSSEISDGLYHDLVWEDLLYVWIAYIGGTLLSLLVFSLEVLYFKYH